MHNALEMHERVLELEKRIAALSLAKSDREMNKTMSNVNTDDHMKTLDEIQDEYVKERNELYNMLKNTVVERPKRPEPEYCGEGVLPPSLRGQ